MSWLPFFSVSIFLTFSLVLGSESKPSPNPKAEKTHRAYFVFGDSLVDNGNNNFLATTARAGLPPYGIDYPTHHPTGRFSNGLNLADIIGQRIGADLLLPYLSPKLKGQKLLNGANFASAGVGILNDTGIQFVNIIRMPSQLAHFKIYQRRVAHLIGIEKTKKLVNEALVLITCGGNDFVNNYYLVPFSPRSLQYKITDYVPLLISEYEKILMRLYKLGARKVVVTGAGPVGCVPAVLAQRSKKGECATDIQQAGDLYDRQLADMLSSLNKKLGSDIFVSAQTKPINVFNSPKAFGFEVSKEACCGQGAYNGLGICTYVSHLCPNRDKYVFWDAYHPTERANHIIVQDILNGTNI